MSNSRISSCEYRNIIKSAVSNDNIKSKINSVISKSKSSKYDQKPQKEDVLSVLRDEGVVDMILENLMHRVNNQKIKSGKQSEVFISKELTPPSSGQYLSLSIVKLTDMSDYLVAENGTVNDKFEYDIKQSYSETFKNGLQMFLSFQKQRISGSIFPCYKEVLVNQQHFIKLLEIPENGIDNLISLQEPLHMVLVKQNMLSGERMLVSSQVIEWRMVLCSETWTTRISIDLQGVFEECKSIIGTIELELQLVPDLSIQKEPLRQNEFNDYLRQENLSNNADRTRKFLAYTRQWWQEFCDVHPPWGEQNTNGGIEPDSCDLRRVKIFAQDENGLNRFVCDFVSPLRSGRLLDSPSLAARFVSAIPFQSNSPSSILVGSNSTNENCWRSNLALLAENRASVENHAVLLCSLLLGLGLNAFVAIGTVRMTVTKRIIPHTWVVTVQEEEPNKATFWESRTGRKYEFQSYPHKPPVTPQFQYCSVGCLFNHFQFYANNFRTCSIETTLFQLTNPSRWKPMSSEVISELGLDCKRYYFERDHDGNGNSGGLSWNNRVPLTVGILSNSNSSPENLARIQSNDLEHQLRGLFESMRQHNRYVTHHGLIDDHNVSNNNHSTMWDDQLCYLLGQALFSYEQEQLTGLSNVANLEFQHAVQRHVEQGHTFKAYPLHVLHLNAKAILETALKSPIFQEILNCRGSSLKFAVRVRVFSYAENVTPVWIIFGCTYMFN